MRESDPDREARLKQIEAELDDELGFRESVEIEHEPLLASPKKSRWSFGKIALVALGVIVGLALLRPLLRLAILVLVITAIVGLVLWIIGLVKGGGDEDD